MNNKKIELPIDVLVDMYFKQLKSLKEIGNVFGCCGVTVGKALHNQGYTLRGDGYIKGKYGKGKKHWAYKTGKYTKQGYVFIYNPEHPNAQRGYVREHVLIMESILGRYLSKGEVVHHINGVRDDNRPENLEISTQSEHMRKHKSTVDGKFGKVIYV